jgi:transglutaminase-like putative cysteine protease
MYSLQIEIPAASPRPDPAGLLIPIPPDTAYQRLTSVKRSETHAWTSVRSLEGDQAAFFFPGTEGANASVVYEFSAGDGKDPAHHFDLADNRFTRASPELKQTAIELTNGASNQREALRRLVDFTASLFEYDHPPVKFYDGMDDIPMLSCSTKGSCTDIHTFLISSLRSIGVPCTYYSGYFFPASSPPTATGFHCWVTTLADGVHEDWDFAKYLKTGRRDVLPALNPVTPGVRLAMGCGRGLRFAVAGQEAMLPHLAYPWWIFSDGSCVPANAQATLSGPGPRVQETALPGLAREREDTADERGARFAAAGGS